MSVAIGEGTWYRFAMQSGTSLTHCLYAYLSDEGFQPKIDDTGQLSFKYEGCSFLTMIDPEDPAFLGVIFPAIYKMEVDEASELRVLRAMDALARTLKAVKFVTDAEDREVHATFETVMPRSEEEYDQEGVGRVLLRGVRALKYARGCLYEAVSKAV